MAESLTDAEFNTVTAEIPLYDQTTYDDLSRILKTREGMSNMQERLTSFYTAKGVVFTPAKTGSSNIFIGGAI